MEVSELSISLVDFPFLLAQADLDDVLGVGLLLLFGLFGDCLAYGDVEILAIYIGVYLFSEGGDVGSATLLDVSCELECGKPFAASNALHSLTIFHDFLKLLHSIIFLL